VQRRERRAVLKLDTGVTWERLTAENDPGVDFIVSVYNPGGASAAEGTLVRHGGHEYHVVVRGELNVTLGFKTFTLRPGDSISFDSFEPHMLANHGNEPAEVISAVVGRAATSRKAAS
jgi:mannose-6-phosphate isomerase-like protein (cupin superfamily)